MQALQRILALAAKELLVILKDKKSRFVLIAPPIVQLIVFGYAATFDLNDIPFAVYNEDRGAASRELIARVAGSPHFHRLADLDHVQQIAPLLDNKQVLMVLHLGPRFSADLQRDRSAPAQLLIDGRNSNTALLALGYLRTIVADFNADWAKQNGLPGPPAQLQVRPWFNTSLLSSWFVVPGIVGLLTLVISPRTRGGDLRPVAGDPAAAGRNPYRQIGPRYPDRPR